MLKLKRKLRQRLGYWLLRRKIWNIGIIDDAYDKICWLIMGKEPHYGTHYGKDCINCRYGLH